MSKKRTIYYLLGIVLLAIILRLPTFLYGYVNIDENDYALAANVILNGGMPYRDFLIYQPPIIYYIYALGFFLSGGLHFWAVHMITISFVVGTVLSLYALVSKVSGSMKGGLAAALAYAVYSTTFLPMDVLATNCEILMMLPVTLSVLLLYMAEQKRSLPLFLLSGIMIGLGICTKYQGGVMLVAAFFYLMLLAPLLKKRFSFLESLVAPLAIATGAVLPALFFVAYFYFKGSLPQAIEAFQYILLYAKGPPQSDALYIVIKFFTRSAIFSLSSLPIWIGAFAIIFREIKLRFKDPSLPPFIAFLIVWFLISILPIIMGGRMYFHYYLLILPAACALGGVWWALAAGNMRKWVKIVIIAWMIVCVAGWSFYAISKPFKAPGKKETWIQTGNYLKEIAKPGDTLFVWGLCHQLYIISGMELATRFTAADYLTGRSPMTAGLEFDPNMPNPPSSLQKVLDDFIDRQGVVIFDTSANIFPQAWKYFKDDTSKKLPTYIVDTAPSNYRRYARYPVANYPYLRDLIEKHYVLIKEMDGYLVYKLIK